MVFKQIIMLHLLFVALLSVDNFAGDIEVQDLVSKKKTRIVRQTPAKQACMECRRLKVRCKKLPQDQKCEKCKKNNKACVFKKVLKNDDSQKITSVEINSVEAASSETKETKNSPLKPYPAQWLDESIYFPNLTGHFISEDY